MFTTVPLNFFISYFLVPNFEAANLITDKLQPSHCYCSMPDVIAAYYCFMALGNASSPPLLDFDKLGIRGPHWTGVSGLSSHDAHPLSTL